MEEQDRKIKRREFAEKCALILESQGLSRMAGRVYGWLLVADTKEQTLNDLGAALQASKSSLSVATRTLIQYGMLERMSKPGQRRDYFRVRVKPFAEIFNRRLEQVTQMRTLFDRAIELSDDNGEDFEQDLQDVRDRYAFLEDEIPKLIERWEVQASRT